MPRRRSIIRRRASAALEVGLAEGLLRGTAIAFTNTLVGGSSRRKWSPAQHALMAEAWKTHRAALLDAWRAVVPGTRPWAWWEHDAPERRRIVSVTVDGSPAPLSAVPASVPTRRHEYGVVGELWGGDWPFNLDFTYETELAYLERLGLLAHGELEALRARGAEAELRTEGDMNFANRPHAEVLLRLFPDDPRLADWRDSLRTRPRSRIPSHL